MTTSRCSVMNRHAINGASSAVNTVSKLSTPCKVAVVTTAPSTRALRGRRAMRPSGDDRELAILATAERLLEERSLADISVDDLAKGAGLSRPTFYFYFASKEAVLLIAARAGHHACRLRVRRCSAAATGGPAAGVAQRHQGVLRPTFGSHRTVARAATEALATSSELRSVWLGFMQKWIDQTAAMIDRRTGARRRAGDDPRRGPGDVAEPDERAHDDRRPVAAETPAVDEDRVRRHPHAHLGEQHLRRI